MLDPLHCVEVVELVTDYLEGALVPDEQARFEARTSPSATRASSTSSRSARRSRATGAVEPEAVPPEVLDRLLHVYRELRGT